jgi:hypothetical protein
MEPHNNIGLFPCFMRYRAQLNNLDRNISVLKSRKIIDMTNVNINASEPNKPVTPAQPSQNPQQNQQPGDGQKQQGGSNEKPAQQK